jgi:hypothetical protein
VQHVSIGTGKVGLYFFGDHKVGVWPRSKLRTMGSSPCRTRSELHAQAFEEAQQWRELTAGIESGCCSACVFCRNEPGWDLASSDTECKSKQEETGLCMDRFLDGLVVPEGMLPPPLRLDPDLPKSTFRLAQPDGSDDGKIDQTDAIDDTAYSMRHAAFQRLESRGFSVLSLQSSVDPPAIHHPKKEHSASSRLASISMALTGRSVFVPASVFGDTFKGIVLQVRGTGKNAAVDVYFTGDDSVCSFPLHQVRKWRAVRDDEEDDSAAGWQLSQLHERQENTAPVHESPASQRLDGLEGGVQMTGHCKCVEPVSRLSQWPAPVEPNRLRKRRARASGTEGRHRKVRVVLSGVARDVNPQPCPLLT